MKRRKEAKPPRKKPTKPPLNERLSYSALYKMWREGTGPPSRKVGTRRIIEAEAGKRWLAGQDA